MKNNHKSYAMQLANTLAYLSPEEVVFLRTLAKSIEIPRPIIVNIGAGAGTSGLAFREARPDCELYTVDISPGGPLGGLEGERNAFDKGERRYPKQILGDSKEIGKNWEHGPIDLVFIDGDHSYEGIHGDLTNWYPHVKKNGIIAIHDYEGSKWELVKPVTDDFMKDNEVLGLEDSIIAFRKTHG